MSFLLSLLLISIESHATPYFPEKNDANESLKNELTKLRSNIVETAANDTGTDLLPKRLIK